MSDIRIETWIVGLGILLALWYLGASIYNRRRGMVIYRWLQAGLDTLGGEPSGKWIGSSGSGAQLHIHKADPPLKTADIIYLLASRELLPLFLVDLVRNKRDRLIIKAELRKHVSAEAEIVPEQGRHANQLRADQEKKWDISTAPHQLLMAVRGAAGSDMADALQPFIQQYGPHIDQLSWSRKAPQLIITLRVAGLYEKGGSAASLFEDMLKMVASLTQ